MTKQLKNAKTGQNIYPTLEEGQITQRELSEDIKERIDNTIYVYEFSIHCEDSEEGYEYRLSFNVRTLFVWYGIDDIGVEEDALFFDVFDNLSVNDIGVDRYNDNDLCYIDSMDTTNYEFIVRFIRQNTESEPIGDDKDTRHTTCKIKLINKINGIDE